MKTRILHLLKETGLIRWILCVLVFMFSATTNPMQAQTITIDKSAYAPSVSLQIAGTFLQTGEVNTLKEHLLCSLLPGTRNTRPIQKPETYHIIHN